MHRDIFRLQLANNRRLIKNLPPPWLNAITSDITSKFGYGAIFSNLRFLLSKTQFISDIVVKSSDKSHWDKWQLFF